MSGKCRPRYLFCSVLFFFSSHVKLQDHQHIRHLVFIWSMENLFCVVNVLFGGCMCVFGLFAFYKFHLVSVPMFHIYQKLTACAYGLFCKQENFNHHSFIESQ